jgi:hypothetical protein
VVVWPGGGGDPTTYLNGWTYFPEYGAYDGSGNLFFDADQNTSPSALLLKELPSAGKEIQNVSVDKGLPAQAGGMEWLGGHAFAMAAGGNLTYRLLISGSVATVRGTTRLRGLRYSSSTSIADGTIVETRNPKAVGIWSYPKGGRVVHEITGLGIAKYLGGLTVSVAPSDTRTRH